MTKKEVLAELCEEYRMFIYRSNTYIDKQIRYCLYLKLLGMFDIPTIDNNIIIDNEHEAIDDVYSTVLRCLDFTVLIDIKDNIKTMHENIDLDVHDIKEQYDESVEEILRLQHHANKRIGNFRGSNISKSSRYARVESITNAFIARIEKHMLDEVKRPKLHMKYMVACEKMIMLLQDYQTDNRFENVDLMLITVREWSKELFNFGQRYKHGKDIVYRNEVKFNRMMDKTFRNKEH